MVMQVPLAGQMLGDFGADVIKVERPSSGDILRTLDPVANEAGSISSYYAALCRNKRVICLDIKQPQGREALLQLLDRADVLLHNFRPGVMERLGLGYADLTKRNPRLIYATAVSLTQGIMAALIERERSGLGQAITTSLFEVAIGIQTLELASRTMHGIDTSWVRQAMIYRVTDGWAVVLMLFRDNPLQLLCRAFGIGDLSREPTFATLELQIANKAQIQEVFDPLFAQQTSTEVLTRLSQVDILCSPINDLSVVINHPQTKANGVVWEIDVPVRGRTQVAGNPVHLSRTPAGYFRAPALLGEHNDEVLAEFGLSATGIERLRAAGVLSEDPRIER